MAGTILVLSSATLRLTAAVLLIYRVRLMAMMIRRFSDLQATDDPWSTFTSVDRHLSEGLRHSSCHSHSASLSLSKSPDVPSFEEYRNAQNRKSLSPDTVLSEGDVLSNGSANHGRILVRIEFLWTTGGARLPDVLRRWRFR